MGRKKDAFYGGVAGGAIVAIIAWLLWPKPGVPQSTVGLTILVNSSTTRAEVGVGQTFYYEIIGGTPHGLVDVLIQATPSPVTLTGSVTATTADPNGAYAGAITVPPTWTSFGGTAYLYAYDRATNTHSVNAVVLTIKPTGIPSPVLSLVANSVPRGGTLSWRATGIMANGPYSFVTTSSTPDYNTLQTGFADALGKASGALQFPANVPPPGVYTATLTDMTTGFFSQVQFTVT